MSDTILITGASGFIGKALRQHLSSHSKGRVIGISRSGRGCLKADLMDTSVLKNILLKHRPSIVFHLAGGRTGSFAEMIADNVLTTINLLETIASIRGYHPRIIVAGSAAEYGGADSPRPIFETAFAKPASFYGQSKLMQTRAVLDYARRGEDIVIARIFNIIGPGIPDHLAAGKFAREIVLRENKSAAKPFAVADLGGVRDLLDIRDICEALVVLSSRGKSGKIYNICSQKGVVMRDLLAQMIALSKNPRIKFTEDKTTKPGVLYAVGSCAKFRRISGWQPKYDLNQSIRDTLKFYRNSPQPPL